MSKTHPSAKDQFRERAQHTPGPWQTRMDMRNSLDREIGDANGSFVIATVHRFAGDVDANAHLIAACPSMYEYIQRQSEKGDAEAISIIEAIHATK